MKKLSNIRWTKKRMVLAGLALWIAYWALDVNNWIKAPDRNPATFVAYNDSAGQVVRLSEQKARPFKVSGKTLEEHADLPYHNIQNKYYEPISQFPSVLDCLDFSEWNKPKPDLTKIDWGKFDNYSEAEVCLYRIADSYGSSSGIKSWMKTQFFDVVIPLQVDEETLNIQGIWKMSNHAPIIATYFFGGWHLAIFSYNASITFSYKNDMLFSTHFSYSF
jgi:hypothetical protein